jgi:hypothetical protein
MVGKCLEMDKLESQESGPSGFAAKAALVEFQKLPKLFALLENGTSASHTL